MPEIGQEGNFWVWFGLVMSRLSLLLGLDPFWCKTFVPISKTTPLYQLNLSSFETGRRYWATKIGHKLTWNTCPYQTKPKQSIFSCFIGFVKLHLWITPKTEHVWFHGDLILVLWCHTLHLPYSTPLYHFLNKYYATGPLCHLEVCELSTNLGVKMIEYGFTPKLQTGRQILSL